MANIEQEVNEDKRKKSGCAGCIVTLLMIFLVGVGSCTGIVIVTNYLDNEYSKYQMQKSVQLFQEIKTRIDNNQATATDYYLFANMIDSYKIRKEIGIEKSDSDKLYLDYLQQAINNGSQEAKLEYANFLCYKNNDITDNDLDDKEKKEKYLKLKQAIMLTEEVFNTQCKVYYKPRYPKFYAYPTGKGLVKFRSDVLDCIKREKIKSNYPELYQLAEKAEKTYKKNCEKDKP